MSTMPLSVTVLTRKGSPPFEAKEFIEKGAGKEFDPKVVEAFLAAFRRGELDVPNVVV